MLGLRGREFRGAGFKVSGNWVLGVRVCFNGLRQHIHDSGLGIFVQAWGFGGIRVQSVQKSMFVALAFQCWGVWDVAGLNAKVEDFTPFGFSGLRVWNRSVETSGQIHLFRKSLNALTLNLSLHWVAAEELKLSIVGI